FGTQALYAPCVMAALLLAADFWVAGGTVVDAAGARPAALHVRAGRVAEVAKEAPAGAEKIDARGLYLAPAVIDAHVHLSVAGALSEVAEAETRSGIAA